MVSVPSRCVSSKKATRVTFPEAEEADASIRRWVGPNTTAPSAGWVMMTARSGADPASLGKAPASARLPSGSVGEEGSPASMHGDPGNSR